MTEDLIRNGAAPSARLLDLSRLVSRVGRGPWTGVDRVEAAYLTALQRSAEPLFALIRTSLGFVLLDRTGVAELSARLNGLVPWGRPDWRSRLHRRATPLRRRAEAELRRLALARCRSSGLAAMLKANLPGGTAWLTVGHANLDPVVFDAIHGIPGGRASVLVHDMIPLDHPDWQRTGTVASFEVRMRTVSDKADLVICNSKATEADCAHHFDVFGRVPPMITAHLGVSTPKPDIAALHAALDLPRRYFVVLGTIEPRKNHALLFRLWDHFAATLPADEIPMLVVAGARGWKNEDVFTWLDTSPLAGRQVREIAGLSDEAVAALIAGADALLMPSHAEGFGLPPAEALRLGTPVIANPLPVYWEILGNNPIYAPVDDMYSWATRILEIAKKEDAGRQAAVRDTVVLPTWQEHFNLVLKVT